MRLRIAFALLACLFWSTTSQAEDALRILFLGDTGHHRPADRAAQLIPVMKARGIEVKYTDDMNVLSADSLAKFDGLLIYSNETKITPEQEKALLDYVESGKGFIPLHCASYCFLNSDKYIALVGAQFLRHGTGDVRTRIVAPEHPIMKGFDGFESWDETYVHTKHNEKDRTVLEVRADQQGFEPWTWVRTQGKGRVFYSAWGHDERTWSNPGFHNLVERGIRWAVGKDPQAAPKFTDPQAFEIPEITAFRKDVKPFEFIDVGPKIPFYPKGEKWGTQGKNLSLMQAPLPAEESQKHLVTPVGFEPKLFAHDPQLQGKPIAMNWDARGRLWVCETYDYPNELQPIGQGRDRIRICEDTDHDGAADKFTVFAEKLSIPTAITFYRGGAVVQDGVETVYLRDTNGDDVADDRIILMTGWGMGDTHGEVSNFQLGLDNWIWAMQGYNQSSPTFDGKPQASFRQGFFRFRLEGEEEKVHVAEIEFIRSTNNNTWGLGISEDGIILGSTANHCPSVYMPIANRYYERVRGWGPQVLEMISDTHLFQPATDKVRQMDHAGGYTAACGGAIYTGRTYPQSYWNRTKFVCEPTGHLVGTFVLRRDGSDFTSQNTFNILASDDEWSSPVLAEVGPDGNLWVIDWYNYIIQHNPTPQGFKTGKGNAYETDLRDKKHGRIYRLLYGGQSQAAGAFQPIDLVKATSAQRVAALANPTMLVRKQAQQLLIESGDQSVIPSLLELVKSQAVDEIGLNAGAIHALWTLKGLGALKDEQSPGFAVATAALKHPSPGVRRNALQVLPNTAASTEAVVSAGVLDDADAQVRLAALLALADLPGSGAAGESLSGISQQPDSLDRWTRDGVIAGAANNASGYLVALSKVKEPSEASLRTATVVAEHVARGKPTRQEMDPILAAVASAPVPLVEAVFNGLASNWPRGHKLELSEPTEKSLLAHLESYSAGTRGQVVRLAGVWGSKAFEAHIAGIVTALAADLKNADKSDADRVAAARQLVELKPDDAGVVESLLESITAQSGVGYSTGVLEALSASTTEGIGGALVDKLDSLTPEVKRAALRSLLSRPATSLALLAGFESGKVSLTDLSLDQKQALANHPDRTVRELAKKLLAMGGGLPNPDREKVVKELMPLTEQVGDPALGKVIFTKNCSKCHMHSGEGQKIGPDLTGMAVHPKRELLVHILDPSRSVEGNFRTYTVVTIEGQVLTGMLASETRTSIELIDTEAKRHPIQRSDIEELKGSTKSLMPEGFEKQVTPTDIANLLEFLTQRGKYTPLDLRKVATVVSTKPMFFDQGRSTDLEKIVFSDWSPKTFEGVPFLLVDPQGDRIPNALMLHGTNGDLPPRMPRQVELPVNQPVKAIHFLGLISGWGFPAVSEKTDTVTVRVHFKDGSTEDHVLKNGVHFADYIRRVDVPGSKFAFGVRGQQVRYCSVDVKRSDVVTKLELIKGADPTSPVLMAITVEGVGK
jgi:putative membrane-bound dehydrogenase-like protein